VTCPKCGATLRSYERNNVTIDQCTECRGIFLDRGELERLIDAEAAYDRQPARERDHYSDHGDLRRGERPRKRGFLGELFD
jgi:Zn-finger nucleic acid-binding protein